MKKLFSIIVLLSLAACETEEINVNSVIPKELFNEAVLLRERALRDNLSVELVEYSPEKIFIPPLFHKTTRQPI